MFAGFTPETFDFLWGIRMNNDREWFLSHKQQYLDTLYEPMKALGQELFQPFLDRSGDLLKVSRIYRDARMHHPAPYKESLWLSVRQESDWWFEAPCLYFDIRPEGAAYGFSFHQPKPASMERFRRGIGADPDGFLALIAKTEEAAGLPVTAQCYKRPKPCEDARLAPYFAWKSGISCVRQVAPGETLFSPQVGQDALALFEALIPLYDFFNRFKA